MKGGKPWAVCPTITTGPHKKTFVYLHNGKGHCRLGTLSRSSRYRISYVETSGKNCILVTCVCRCINIWDCALRTDHHHQIEQLKVLALLRVPPLTQMVFIQQRRGWFPKEKKRKVWDAIISVPAMTQLCGASSRREALFKVLFPYTCPALLQTTY